MNFKVEHVRYGLGGTDNLLSVLAAGQSEGVVSGYERRQCKFPTDEVIAMDDEQLHNLLHRAEADWRPASLEPSELAQSVRRRAAKRQQRIRSMQLMACLIVSLGIGVGIVQYVDRQADQQVANVPTKTQTIQLPVDNSVDLQAKIARLQAEADFHQQVARRIVALEQQDRAHNEALAVLAEEPALDVVAEQLDVVANRMVLRADSLRADMRPAAEAAEIYQEVIRLFPATTSADSARERLMQLGFKQGDA